MKYIVLVWAADTGKFVQENITKLSKEQIVIVGNSLKMDDLKALQNMHLENIVFDSVEPEKKEQYELFLLGKASALSCGFLIYGNGSKAVTDMAKAVGVELISFQKFISGEEKTVRERKKKDTPAPLKEKTTPPAEDTVSIPEVKKEALEKSEKTVRTKKTEDKKEISVSGSSSKKKADMILQLIEESKLSKEEKEFFSTPGKLSMLEEVIKASNESSLKLQVQFMFGDSKGQAVLPILEKNFKKLKKELG